MIPRSAVDGARDAAAAASAVWADGSPLDMSLRSLGAKAGGPEWDEARGRAADILRQAQSSVVGRARDTSDSMWAESFGSAPAEHAHEAGFGLFSDRVFDAASVMFDGKGDPAEFSHKVRGWLAGEYDRAYDKAMEDSAATVPGTEVRYAHVPAGPKPCARCLEMASKGFSYERPPRAENHPGCQCVVVPGTVKTRVEGYDPEGVADRIAKCAETVGIDPKTDDERLRKLIRDEMGRRDPQWIQDNEPLKGDYSLVPRESIGIIDENYEFAGINEKKYPEWRDLFAIDTMLANGIPWKPRPQASGRGMDGVTSPDGESLGFMVEIKSPRNGTKSPKPGNELEFVFDCLKKAKHNFSNPYDYVERIAAGHAVKPVKVVLSTRYRTGSWNTSDFESKLRREMMAIGIDEVLWIDAGGRIRRYI